MDIYDAVSPFRVIANIVDSFTSMFGFNMAKEFTKGKYDWANLNKAISDAFKDIEIQNSKELNTIQGKLESLIAMPGGENIRKVVNKVKRDLRNKLNNVQANAARLELNKVRAQNLANDISQARLGDLTIGRDISQKKEEFSNLTQNPTGPAVPTTNKDIDLNKVERKI